MNVQPALYELSVFADFNSFLLLADDTAPPDPATGWVGEVISTMIAARPGVLCVGTARRMDVPVTVEVRVTEPDDANLAAFDHVTEASIETTTGRLRIEGGTDTPSTAFQFNIPPGVYRVRIYATGFGTLSEDAIEGDDHYRIVIWPGEPQVPRVLKRYSGELPGG